MLRISSLSASYGAIRAVTDLSLHVADGGLVALIGSNGAGKSTTLRTIVGLHRTALGRVDLAGENVTGARTHALVRRGMAYVPEGRMVVAPLSVAENLDLGAAAKRSNAREFGERRDFVYEMFPRLAERRTQLAASLSGGEQQMLAIGRALMTNPRCLLLDEPSMGLAPLIVDLVFESIVAIHATGMSILLVEQNAALALEICDHAYVLERGRIVIDGTASAVQGTSEVMAADLG